MATLIDVGLRYSSRWHDFCVDMNGAVLVYSLGVLSRLILVRKLSYFQEIETKIEIPDDMQARPWVLRIVTDVRLEN